MRAVVAAVVVFVAMVLAPTRIDVWGYVNPSAEGVTVCMERCGADVCVTTDANGEWHIRAVAEGETYTVYAPGGQSVTDTWDAPRYGPHKLDVEVGDD